MAHIVVVNNDPDFITLMTDLLTERGWRAEACRESATAFAVIKQTQPDVVILDVRMEAPDSGWKLLDLMTLDPETSAIAVIVCSAAVDELREKEEWLAAHQILTLPKPFDIEDLYARVEAVLRPDERRTEEAATPLN